MGEAWGLSKRSAISETGMILVKKFKHLDFNPQFT
jgi:hypothetical protein